MNFWRKGAVVVVIVVCVGAIGAHPRRMNEAQVGGGYGATGVDVEEDGDILTNGDVTIDGSLDAGSYPDLDSEAELEALLSDVTDVYTDNDGSLDDDDVSDDNTESMATAGGAGTVPMSDGASGLAMTDVIAETELDAEAELEAQLADVTDVYTNNDGSLDDDDLSDNAASELSDAADIAMLDEDESVSGNWDFPGLSVVTTAGAELVANGTFETDLTGWTNSGTGGVCSTWERNTTAPITGTGDLHFVANGAGYSGGLSTAFGVSQGHTYDISVTYKSDTAGWFGVYKTGFYTGNLLAGYALQSYGVAGSETTVTYSFMATETDAEVYLCLMGYSAGEYWFDDVTLIDQGGSVIADEGFLCGGPAYIDGISTLNGNLTLNGWVYFTTNGFVVQAGYGRYNDDILMVFGTSADYRLCYDSGTAALTIDDSTNDLFELVDQGTDARVEIAGIQLEAGGTAAEVAQRFGASATEGLEYVVLDEDLALSSGTSINMTNAIPTGSVIVSVQANIETAVTGNDDNDEDLDAIGIGDGGAVDEYGESVGLAQNVKIDTMVPHAVTSGALTLCVNGTKGSGGGACTETFTGSGVVRIRVVYQTLNSLDDA